MHLVAETAVPTLGAVQLEAAKVDPVESSAAEKELQEIADKVHNHKHPCLCLLVEMASEGSDHGVVISSLAVIGSCGAVDLLVDHHENPKHGNLVHLDVVSHHEQRSDP